MKETPIFNFLWKDGGQRPDYEIKGFFMDVCIFYWKSQCVVNHVSLRARFKNDKSLLEKCFSKGLIKLDEDGFAEIDFFDEQRRRSTWS